MPLQKGQRRTKFLTGITKAVNSSNKATDETRNLVCSLLARDPDYKVPYSETAHSEGFSLFDRLDKEATFAIISNAGLNTRQTRSLRRDLMGAIGTPLLAVETKIKDNLGSKEDEEDIVIGKYVIVEPKWHVINWRCRKMDQVVLNYL